MDEQEDLPKDMLEQVSLQAWTVCEGQKEKNSVIEFKKQSQLWDQVNCEIQL